MNSAAARKRVEYMIFLDNSASSCYKPRCVINAVKNTLSFIPYNPSRASHNSSLKAGLLVYDTRNAVAEAFGCEAERVIFTSGCTEALNLAIFGTAKKGGHVITTVFEHNSVLRPLHELQRAGLIKLSLVSSPEAAAAAVTADTYLLAVNHVSNVTGFAADLAAYGQIAKKHNLLFLADGAQSVGHIRFKLSNFGLDMLAIAPHKGLHAAQGVGVLVCSDRVKLRPFKFGGTGTASSSVLQPHVFPEGLEAGTLPTPAIAGLNAGLKWTMPKIEAHAKKAAELTAYLTERLRAVRGVIVYSKPNICGITAFNIRNIPSDHAGDIYNQRYGIAVRCGFHCAPLLHGHYGTKTGMIRASAGVETTFADIDALVTATSEIAGKLTF